MQHKDWKYRTPMVFSQLARRHFSPLYYKSTINRNTYVSKIVCVLLLLSLPILHIAHCPDWWRVYFFSPFHSMCSACVCVYGGSAALMSPLNHWRVSTYTFQCMISHKCQNIWQHKSLEINCVWLENERIWQASLLSSRYSSRRAMHLYMMDVEYVFYVCNWLLSVFSALVLCW